MSKLSKTEAEKRREIVKRLGNPYASHFYLEEEDATAADARKQLRLSENPYATLHFESPSNEGRASEARRSARPSPSLLSMTKTQFRDGCRDIFIKYIPRIEKGRLRKHHLDFINRNLNRAAEERTSIFRCLCKYDLAPEGSVQFYFNREETDFTEQKLGEIEREALKSR